MNEEKSAPETKAEGLESPQIVKKAASTVAKPKKTISTPAASQKPEATAAESQPEKEPAKPETQPEPAKRDEHPLNIFGWDL